MSLPRDPSMLPAVRQLAQRAAECAGYSETEAERVASSVVYAVDALWKQANEQPACEEMELSFERNTKWLDVWLRYSSACAPESTAFRQELSNEVLQLGVESVEIGREGDTAYCRLRRCLPAEKADNECEEPQPPGIH